MSQFQSNMPGNPPPPGMPYQGNMYGQPKPKTSGAAITALVMGLLLCVPAITGLGAILFGIIGISSTRKPGVGGRGMAIAGLLLGLLNLAGWTGIGGLAGWAWVQSKPDRVVAASFMHAVAAGDLPGAQKLCDTSVSPITLQTTITQVQALGPCNSFTTSGFNVNTANGVTTSTITSAAVFGSTPKIVVVTLSHPSGGTPLVESWQIH